MLCLLSTAPAFLDSCSKAGTEPSEDWGWEEIGVSADSAAFCIAIETDNKISDMSPGSDEGSLDLLVYDTEGMKKLVWAKRVESIPDSVRFWSSRGDKAIVAIANCPAKLNLTALDRFDSAELLSFNFKDENMQHPVMSGSCVSVKGRGTLKLKPIMSRIVLREITNNLGGYTRLEEPRAFLLNRNSSAEALRENGFRPSEFESDTQRVALPYDVGIFTQNPSTELFCYPNDSETVTIGTPATVLVLECEIRGTTRRFRQEISPIKRNSTTFVDMTVESPDTWKCSYY